MASTGAVQGQTMSTTEHQHMILIATLLAAAHLHPIEKETGCRAGPTSSSSQ